MANSPATIPFYINRDFALFWLIRVFATMGFQMMAVAVGWQIYDMTNSALQLGYIGLVAFLPTLLLVLVVGQVADHFDRQKVVQLGHLLECVVALTLAMGCYQGWISELWIFIGVFLLGVGKAFSTPTLAALLPSLVPTAQLPKAVSTASTAMQTAIIVGPAAGGFIYVFGPEAVYGACFAAFAISIVLLGLMKLPHKRPEKIDKKPEDDSIFAGIRYIKSQPVLLGAISLDLFAVLLGGVTAMLPIIAKDLLQTGPEGLGFLRSAPAVGALIVSFYLARHPIMNKAGIVMFAGVAVFGLSCIGVGISTNFWITLVCLFILGGSDMLSVVIRSTLVQLETPDDMRGRVNAVNFLFIGASNQLGEFRSGVTAAWVGLVPSIVLGGVASLAVVGLWMWMFPALAKRDKLVQEQ